MLGVPLAGELLYITTSAADDAYTTDVDWKPEL
jgi:hypothetical protein